MRISDWSSDVCSSDLRTVENAQGTLHLNGKVDVTRRVDDVDPVIVPEASGRGRRDRDAALLFLLHPIHRGGAIVDFPDLVGFAGIIKDTLGGGRLTGIDMRHDAYIALVLERMDAGHGLYSIADGRRARKSTRLNSR